MAKAQPTHQEVIRLAADAQVSVNTVKKWFSGGSMQPSIKARIVAAAKLAKART